MKKSEQELIDFIRNNPLYIELVELLSRSINSITLDSFDFETKSNRISSVKYPTTVYKFRYTDYVRYPKGSSWIHLSEKSIEKNNFPFEFIGGTHFIDAMLEIASTVDQADNMKQDGIKRIYGFSVGEIANQIMLRDFMRHINSAFTKTGAEKHFITRLCEDKTAEVFKKVNSRKFIENVNHEKEKYFNEFVVNEIMLTLSKHDNKFYDMKIVKDLFDAQIVNQVLAE